MPRRPLRKPIASSAIPAPENGFALSREVIEPDPIPLLTEYTPKNPGPANRQAVWVPKFIEALAAFGNIGSACNVAGINRSTYEDLMTADPVFKDAVRLARQQANDFVAQALWERGVRGVTKEKGIWGTKRVKTPEGKYEVVPFQYGKEVETTYSDTAAIFLLKARDPETYADRQRVITSQDPSARDLVIEMARKRGVDPQRALEQAIALMEEVKARKALGLT